MGVSYKNVTNHGTLGSIKGEKCGGGDDPLCIQGVPCLDCILRGHEMFSFASMATTLPL